MSSIDFLATISSIVGVEVSNDKKIDSLDFSEIIYSPDSSESPRDYFFYYKQNNLEAVRNKKWKLHIQKNGKKIRELYDLDNDISEENNLYDEHPGIVKKLMEQINLCIDDIGDDLSNIKGKHVRPPGKVEGPVPLTEFNEKHPYYAPMYDLPDWG
jgi:hypothetical protein